MASIEFVERPKNEPPKDEGTIIEKVAPELSSHDLETSKTTSKDQKSDQSAKAIAEAAEGDVHPTSSSVLKEIPSGGSLATEDKEDPSHLVTEGQQGSNLSCIVSSCDTRMEGLQFISSCLLLCQKKEGQKGSN